MACDAGGRAGKQVVLWVFSTEIRLRFALKRPQQLDIAQGFRYNDEIVNTLEFFYPFLYEGRKDPGKVHQM